MRFFVTLLLAIGASVSAFAQLPNNFWTALPESAAASVSAAQRQASPTACRLYDADVAAMASALSGAPREFTELARQQPLLFTLPMADGSFVTFKLAESPVMAPELAAKFPAIRTYSGRAADGSGLTVRLGVSYNGFHAYVFSLDGHVQIIEPLQRTADRRYQAYRLEDLPDDPQQVNARCGADESAAQTMPHTVAPVSAERANTPVVLKTYRTAISAQAEYSIFHGGTKPLVMSEIVDAIDFITAIQERDFGVRLELIPNNDTLIYFDPATDPYDGDLVTSWFNQNPAPTNQRVGINNYDIGHVFTQVDPPGGVYVAGIASLSGVCTQVDKARAGSSLPQPTGSAFYLIAAHEMGHQFSATHTFNSCPPAADARTGSTAYEPGGGSTIMSYATTCDPEIIGNRDDYYHIASIEQARVFTTQQAGSTCGANTTTDNNFPSVSIPLTDGFYIPMLTPFGLTAEGSDPDGDDLTYCWEEYDLGPEGTLADPQTTAPIFRSFKPVASPTRLFPKFISLITNTSTVQEYMPDYSRKLTFKVTVRDNHPGAGGVVWDDVQFNVTDQAGPFKVTYPNTSGITWRVGEYRVITWDVANTDKSPVNCPTVNIVLSLNSGQTFPVTLAGNVPNTGSCCIQVPDIVGSTLRLKIEAANNIFFDLSNANITILQPDQPGFNFCPGELTVQACAPTTYTTALTTSSLSGFSEPITLSASGLPAGATATFSPNPVQPGQSSVMSINYPLGTAEGQYTVAIEGASATSNFTLNTDVTVVSNDLSGFALQQPLDGSTDVVQTPVLRWAPAVDADKYDIEVANNPSFDAATLISTKYGATVDTFKVPVVLEKGHVYYWHVRPTNECGNGPWSEPYAFSTVVEACTVLAANDVPVSIPANGTPTVESTINIGNGGTISDINVKKITGFHDYFINLEVRLIGPDGTNVLLWKDKCAQSVPVFNIGFDDAAVGIFPCPPPNTGIVYNPFGNLSDFNGKNATGAWKLRVKDNETGSGGQITGFELEICSNAALNAPVLINNNPLVLETGLNMVISTDLLKVEDANNPAGQLTYTLMTVPSKGHLEKNWSGIMHPGDQFTQADIDNGALRYFDYGGPGEDHFRFAVTDGEGGFLTGTYVVQPFGVGVKEPVTALDFVMAPNPTNGFTTLRFNTPLADDTRVGLYDASGRLVRSWSAGAGSGSLNLDVQDLPRGVYAVSVENAKGKTARKLIVQ